VSSNLKTKFLSNVGVKCIQDSKLSLLDTSRRTSSHNYFCASE